MREAADHETRAGKMQDQQQMRAHRRSGDFNEVGKQFDVAARETVFAGFESKEVVCLRARLGGITTRITGRRP